MGHTCLVGYVRISGRYERNHVNKKNRVRLSQLHTTTRRQLTAAGCDSPVLCEADACPFDVIPLLPLYVEEFDGLLLFITALFTFDLLSQRKAKMTRPCHRRCHETCIELTYLQNARVCLSVLQAERLQIVTCYLPSLPRHSSIACYKHQL